MKKIGIVQPGKIGDIIICLPIAKWYFDKGYEVIWPLDKNIISNFLNYVDYVKFVPIDFDCKIAKNVCTNQDCNHIIDLSFYIQNGNLFNGDVYGHQNKYSFDEFKYFIADVPFEEKWNLKINRNIERENALLKKIKPVGQYVVVQEKASGRYLKVDWSSSKTKRIDISEITESVFDWITVLENADQHVLIESCFSNLVDQLNIKVKKQTLLLKHGYYSGELLDGRLKGIPVLRLNWNRI